MFALVPKTAYLYLPFLPVLEWHSSLLQGFPHALSFYLEPFIDTFSLLESVRHVFTMHQVTAQLNAGMASDLLADSLWSWTLWQMLRDWNQLKGEQ